MRSWFILLIIPHSYSLTIPIEMRETEYECGTHGRFEYCIDGVPGCVIGCHCHPGYYFDTDTKICEHNIRLAQNFRRNYDVLEPTRVFIPPTPSVIEEPSTTIRNAVDEKIDIITKDADELGDWLYNQFFKTIENQVINETKDDSIMTRRSDSSPTFIKKPSRRSHNSHRYWRAKRKKKKKKKGLKSKLLRITEDDSLFDSTSDSDSDESSDASSGYDDDDSDEESDEKYKEKKTKNDHGHKKILVYNKRPKPPLPSFIFLPNMETPFFPPIGLPPPAMPMYPMVPVPPMMGAYPFPAPTPCEPEAIKKNETISTEPPQQTNITPQPSESPSEDKPTEANNPDNNLPDEAILEENPLEEIPTEDKIPDENAGPIEENPTDTPPSILRNHAKKRRGPRNKLMQRIHEKLKRKNKLQNYFANEYQGKAIIPPGFIANHLPNMHHKSLPEMNVEEELAALQDVDFKYLSQLIHRADLNRTNQRPLTTTPSEQIKTVLTVPPPSRRNYDSYSDQITQALNFLAIRPMNHFPENQSAFVSPIQATYNVTNHLRTYNEPNYNTYNVHTQHNNNTPNIPNSILSNQTIYNVHSQQTYNVPNQPSHKLPNQPTYNIPNQPTYNVPNQPTYNVPNQPTYNLPNQPTYNVPNQPTYDVANQPTYVSLNQPTHKAPYRKKIEDTNDLYYANLGRQIASMIRNIDGDKEVDIEIKSSVQDPNNPILPQHSGSRSYWERSVRSPYKPSMNSYKKEINSLKLSNENLFNLENKVEIAAATEPTLSLHQLENIISKMHKAKSKFVRTNSRRATRLSISSFNVNLLPAHNQYLNSKGKFVKRVHNFVPRVSKSKNVFNNSNIRRRNVKPPLLPPPFSSSLLNDFMFTIQSSTEILNVTTPNTQSTPTVRPTYVPSIIPTRKSESVAAQQNMYKMPKPHFESYAYTVLPLPPNAPHLTNMQLPYMQATTSRTFYQRLSPMVLNNKAVKYYNAINNNQYLYEKASIPTGPQSFPSNYMAPSRYENYEKRVEPSYFHHEVHHFDYFDDLL